MRNRSQDDLKVDLKRAAPTRYERGDEAGLTTSERCIIESDKEIVDEIISHTCHWTCRKCNRENTVRHIGRSLINVKCDHCGQKFKTRRVI